MTVIDGAPNPHELISGLGSKTVGPAVDAPHLRTFGRGTMSVEQTPDFRPDAYRLLLGGGVSGKLVNAITDIRVTRVGEL